MREGANGEWPVADQDSSFGGSGEPPGEIQYPLGGEHGVVAEGRIQSYRDLRVWQDAMDLVEEVYRISHAFPSDERFGLTSQIRRAAVSVPSNIAEGWGRGRTKEYTQFLRYARASLKEIETQWLIAHRLGFIGNAETHALEDRASVLGRRLLALMRALAQR